VFLFILNQTFKLNLVITKNGGGKIMIRKTSVILVFGLLILSTTGVLITDGKESSKIFGHKNNITEIIETLPPNRENLSYYPKSHDFGNKYEGEVDNTTFEIWNSGCCTLYYELTWNCSWVDVHPTIGISQGEHDTIFVDINTTGLVWGSYICNILITSNNGSGIFTVMVNILRENYLNITVGEAWEFLINTNNGIQIPIDIRTDDEWKKEHIDTPFPENPKHHYLDDLQNETKLKEFKELYNGKEIILYSESSDQSAIAAQMLIDNKFFGTIYNMLGGITTWKAAGYPTIGNRPPEKPTITGPQKGKVGIVYNYTFNTTDLDDDYLYYYINWSDDTGEGWFGPYASGENVIVNHTWSKKGTYIIKTKARDIYNDESIWSNLIITIPRNKVVSKPFMNFLENYPNLYSILGYLLRF